MFKKKKNTTGITHTNAKDVIQVYGGKKAIFFVLMALFFIVIILLYNSLLQKYVKKSILKSGEYNSEKTASDISLYLSKGLNALILSGSSLDDMIEGNASDKEILDYIQYQSNVIIKSSIPGTTGLYACIDGEYFDGLGWVPGDDFVPTERPWYKEAVKGNGSVVLIDPYLDLYTGNIIMTLSKTLSNGKGVVAIDITLDEIQKIVEEAENPGDNATTFIVSSDGFVVAHSDINERGKNYLHNDNLESLILDRVFSSPENSFEIQFNNSKYIVYACPIIDNCYSVTFSDSNMVYRPISYIALFSIIIILATLIIFIIIMFTTGKKDVVNEKLNKVLKSTADIYMSLCDLNVIDNSAVEIKNINPAISKAIQGINHNLDVAFINIMKNLPESPTKQTAIDFCDLRTINERMKDTDTISCEYLSFGNIWVRARFICSERTADGKVSHILWLLENITKERKERERLIDISDSAIAASEAKSAFLSNMSHEIRTPINAILGMNEMIQRESDNPEIVSYSNNIKSAGNSLLTIINDILDFSKIESGKMDIIPVDYDLVSVLNDLVNMIKPRAEAKSLKLIMDIDPETPTALFGDEVRIKQIMINLLTNAVKYTEKGSVTLKVTFDRETKTSQNIILRVSITDTGIGIKKEEIDKLFEKFVRIDEKRNRNIEGTGLGMSITSNLLTMMGGKLDVESEYGKGSTFSFELNQTVRKWTLIGDYNKEFSKFTTKEKYVPKFKAPNAHVIIIDDNAINITVFKGLLKKTGINIDSAENGKAGIQLCIENKYDIIFLDHMMPGMDGIETLNQLKEKYPDNKNNATPVVCLTANAISGAREKYVEAGFTDYLSKPMDPHRLEELIFSYLPENLRETVNE